MASKELVLGELMRKQSLPSSLDLLACGFPEGITGGPIVLYDGRFLRLGFDRVSTFNRVAPFDVASFDWVSFVDWVSSFDGSLPLTPSLRLGRFHELGRLGLFPRLGFAGSLSLTGSRLLDWVSWAGPFPSIGSLGWVSWAGSGLGLFPRLGLFLQAGSFPSTRSRLGLFPRLGFDWVSFNWASDWA